MHAHTYVCNDRKSLSKALMLEVNMINNPYDGTSKSQWSDQDNQSYWFNKAKYDIHTVSLYRPAHVSSEIHFKQITWNIIT